MVADGGKKGQRISVIEFWGDGNRAAVAVVAR